MAMPAYRTDIAAVEGAGAGVGAGAGAGVTIAGGVDGFATAGGGGDVGNSSFATTALGFRVSSSIVHPHIHLEPHGRHDCIHVERTDR